MESSQFSDTHCKDVGFELIESNSASCDTFRVKLYGKLHFLKRLKPEYVDDIRYQEAFRKEFETGYNLEHPNLVHYVSYSDDGILMEYIDGETLTHFLSSHPDYFKNKKNIGKFLGQLLDVVGYLHSHQVLHLDLKPDNIMLTRIDNTVKLIDLGCCYTDTFTDTQGLTNHYAAPEQLAGNSTDARTDIYAIGKILEFLPNHRIYNKVIARCTASNKTERYQTIEQLRHALNKSPMRHFIIWMLSLLLIVGVVSLIWYHGRFQFKSVEAMKDNAPKYETIKTDTQKKDSVNIPFVAQSPMKMIGDVIVQDQGQPNTENKSQSTSLNDLDEEQRFWKAIDSIQKKNAYKSHPFPSDSVLLAPYYRKLGMKAMNLDSIPLTIGQGRWTIPTYMISRKEAIQEYAPDFYSYASRLVARYYEPYILSCLQGKYANRKDYEELMYEIETNFWYGDSTLLHQIRKNFSKLSPYAKRQMIDMIIIENKHIFVAAHNCYLRRKIKESE